MKRILITGANSYIGTNVEKWLMKEPDKYHIETLDMKDPNWENFDFSKFDVVFHVAGIAHIKETRKNKNIYYKVNRDLAYQTAKKAKNSGVKQFVFLSTMSVYGVKKGIITSDTIPRPKKAYGKSKYEAEKLILGLEGHEFKVAILRPPMVYGYNSPGNYSKLSKIALKLPFYPKVNNRRSMIFIDNLAIWIDYLIREEKNGIFLPQNKEYVNTTDLINLIRELNSKKKREISGFNWLLKLFALFSNRISKIFGNLIYVQKGKKYVELVSFEDSIALSEKDNNSNFKIL